MSDNESDNYGEVSIELDDAREIMYRELCEEFGDLPERELEEAVTQQLTRLYDNRAQIRERLEQAQAQQQA